MSEFKEEHVVGSLLKSFACSQILAVSYLLALQVLFVKKGKKKKIFSTNMELHVFYSIFHQVFNCTKLIHGAALQKGFDSHTSPDKHELVIFNTYHILPQYIVHYTSGAIGEFKYTVSNMSSLFSTPIIYYHSISSITQVEL